MLAAKGASQHSSMQPGGQSSAARPGLEVPTTGKELRDQDAAPVAQGQTAAADSGARGTPSAKRLPAADGLVLEQLIVGVLLFTPLLLLLPTTLVFYSFVSILRGGLALVLGAARGLQAGFWFNPVYALVLRLWRPAEFPAGVYFEVLPVGSSIAGGKDASIAAPAATLSARLECVSDTMFLRLTSVPCSLVSLALPCVWQMLAASGVSVAGLEGSG